MPIDPEIFGAPAEQRKDSDIFKDSAPVAVKDEPQPVKKVETEREAILRMARQGAASWGMGFAPKMEDVGVKLAVATGNPYLGAAVGTTLGIIPDAVQMVTGGKMGEAAAQVAKPVTEPVAEFFMRSAMKPTLDQVKKGNAAAAVKT